MMMSGILLTKIPIIHVCCTVVTYHTTLYTELTASVLLVEKGVKRGKQIIEFKFMRATVPGQLAETT